MADSLANQLIRNEVEKLSRQTFPEKGKVFMRAARALLYGVASTGRMLLCTLARTLPEGETSLKGRQEQLSRWLQSYDFHTPIRAYLWQQACALTQRDSIIAIDATDISKAYGGRGIEGMAMGWDGSLKVKAMGYDALAAGLVYGRRTVPFCFDLHAGRKGLPEKERALLKELHNTLGDKGIFVADRGFDSLTTLSYAHALGHRTVIRLKTLTRDLFASNRPLHELMGEAPSFTATLRSQSRKIAAQIRYRQGYLQHCGTHIPILLVSSTLDGAPLLLYALNLLPPNATPQELRTAALTAANAYFNRWSIETFFQDLKGQFSIEETRVLRFQRFRNLVSIALLAYSLVAHTIPQSPTFKKLNKLMKDNLLEISLALRPFLSNLRQLLSLPHPRHITGRPHKEKPPDPTLPLPGFTF